MARGGATTGKTTNKVKRKRGKKFRYYEGGATKSASAMQENPFEDHSSSKKAQRDKLKVSSIRCVTGVLRGQSSSKSTRPGARITCSLTDASEGIALCPRCQRRTRCVSVT